MATIQAKIRTQVPVQARTVVMGSQSKLTHLADIDTTEIGEGALLIYNASTEKFHVKQELANSSTTVTGGKY